MNIDKNDDINQTQQTELYQKLLFTGYTDEEITEIKNLMEMWDKATYPNIANSIVDHADRHGFAGNYLKYLRKAANFHKKGARKKLLPNGAERWNKGNEFLIERNSKIVSYGEN